MTEGLTLTATGIAEYFRYRCDRQFRYQLVPTSARGGEVPAPNHDPAAGPRVGPRPGAQLLMAAGRRWERQVLERLLRRTGTERVRFAGWRADGTPARLPYAEVVETLRAPGEIRVLVQPELRLPPGTAARWGLRGTALGFGSATPDLIRVIPGRQGRVRFQVVDIKASAAPGISHYAQVAYYTMVLEAVLAAEGVAGGVTDTRIGRIWARNGRGPERFPLAAYRHHVERFLTGEVAALAASAPAASAWHLSTRCGGCLFLEHCRAEADAADDVSRIPGITPLAKAVLRERGIRTVGQLAQDHGRDTYTGCHALEANEARLRASAQALRYGKSFDVARTTELMPAAEGVRLLLTADADPVSQRCYALGLGVAGRGPAGRMATAAFVAAAGTDEGERAALLRLLEAVAEAAEGASSPEGRGTRRAGAGIHLYVYDHAEKVLLHALLARHLGDAAVRRATQRVATFLGIGDDAVGLGALGTVLVDAVRALVALPVAYAYDLASVSDALQPKERPWVHRPPPHLAVPFSSQIAFEAIHAAWRSARRGDEDALREITELVHSKLEAVDSVLRALRERSERAGRLRLRKPPLVLPPGEPPLADARLETLRLFTRMEAAAEAMSVRALHALPTEERARRWEAIRGMELVERREDGTLVFEFDAACRDVKFRVGDFTLLLTNDDGRSLGELAERPWDRRRLMMELVAFEPGHTPPRVVLSPTGAFDRAIEERQISLDRQCVLDRAPADYTTRRVLASLRALDGPDEAAARVRALLAGELPVPVQPRAPAGEIVASLLQTAAARHGRPVLNADQAAAWRAALEDAVTLVWGPPGTGKTYLLAWVLIGLAAAAARAGRPCRMLVSAATHRAIVNVLARVAAEWGAAAAEVPLRLVKLRGSGNDADRELEGTAVECVPDSRLPALLRDAADGAALVVGSTVWSLWKQMRAAGGGEGGEGLLQPWFDVVVIDEASQMKVAESLIALSALRPGGQVIVCGDDRQLAPITRGRYAAHEETLYGSVFGHFARHVPRQTLRESRRMNAALVRYPRDVYYPGLVSMEPLQRIALAGTDAGSDALDAALREAFLAPDDAVVFFTYRGVRAAARNPFEAALAARIARLARRQLNDPGTGERFSDARFVSHGLAVLSPHRAQNSAILAELRATGLGEAELPLVDTVERMQGNEREMVIVSYAVADREYAEAEAEFLLNPNRFNVSITRPRAKLIVLMSEEVLAAVPADERVLSEALPVQGYRAHCSDGARDLLLTAPDGSAVEGRCHYLRLPPASATPPGRRLDTPPGAS